MRRPRLLVCLAAITLLLALQILSLWNFYWQSASHASYASLSQGSLRVWSSQPGDLPGTAGYILAGWTGDTLLWKPELNTSARLWVIPAAPLGSPAPMARRLTGFCLVLPIIYPLALTIAATGLGLYLPRLIQARRRRAGRCPACGYDMTGGTTTCPECGSLHSRIRVLLRSLISRRAAPHAGLLPRAAP